MKTISVKGVGSVAVKPNLIVISMSLESVDLEYEKAVNLSSDKINNLSKALCGIGFEKSAVKTTNFNVSCRYENVKGSDGNYTRQFVGYACLHNLKLEFDFDTKKLSETLAVIAGCMTNPNLNISFTIKDNQTVLDDLLKDCCKNAKAKAQILCEGSGVKLGELVSIDYNWVDVNLYSKSNYNMTDDCVAPMMRASKLEMNFDPDDIKVEDTVAFVWEIK